MLSKNEHPGFGRWALSSLLLAILFLFTLVFASQFRGWMGAFGIGGLIFLSAATVGALLGFIFAVPRVVAKDGTAPNPEDGRDKLLSTNTNLERISDWLTTMLVGVGLSQLTNLNGVFLQFRQFLAETATVYDQDGHPSAGVLPAVGPFILVLGAACGFLFMYLLTRLVLVGFFRHSEEMLSGVAVAAIRVAVSQAQPDRELSAVAEDGPTSPTPNEAGGPNRQREAETNGPQFTLATPVLSAATAATLRRATQATMLSNDDALEIMFELLYEPAGYRRVIQMSGELSRTSIVKRPEYWFYLAAAFGQQLQHAEEDSDEWASARENALDAARRAVQIDKAFRGRLWAISDSTSMDNDLAPLRKDEAFLRIVGRV